jgi:hypothetical protein
MFPNGFWESPIWKEAARAGLRQISRLVSQGNLAGASQLATTPGVLKPSVAGSQIKHLGRGGEGVASLVAHPEHGVAVRKLFDPRGISGPEMIARKEQAGRALGDNPHFAKFLGSAQTPHGGQMHFNEYVQPGQAPAGQAGAQSIRHTQVQAQRGLTNAGFAGGKDIREGNMIYDASAGRHRSIDYLPAQRGEFMRMPKTRQNMMVGSPGMASPLNDSYNPEQAGSTGGMIGRLVGGKSLMRGIRNGPIGTADTIQAPVSQVTVPRSPNARAQGTPAPRQTPMISQTVPHIPPARPLGKPVTPQALATVPARKPQLGIS